MNQRPQQRWDQTPDGYLRPATATHVDVRPSRIGHELADTEYEKRMVQKRCFYEWSARIPLIMHFPGDQYAGTKVTEPVSLIDLVPTLLDWAGVPIDDRLPMAATSLTELLAGNATRPHIVFSEYHVEKVRAPCFMARTGTYKYIYIHGYGSQLFDLAVDPGEWHNLVGRPELAAVEAELHRLIREQFDPDQFAADGLLSVQRRELLRQAVARNHTHWDYFPYVDATQQYVR